MRPADMGRKNRLFDGSEAGGRALAIVFTCIETAKMKELAPEAWLTWVPVTLPLIAQNGLL